MSDLHSSTATSDLDDDPMEIRARRLREEAVRLQMRPEDLEVFIRAGVPFETIPAHPQMRRTMLAYLRKKETPPPVWVVISGIWPEVALDSAERRKRVRALYKAAELLIRRELKRHEVDEFRAEGSADFLGSGGGGLFGFGDFSEQAFVFLQGVDWEFFLIQVIDGIRAEGLRGKLRAGIREFVGAFRKRAGEDACGTGGTWCIFGNGNGSVGGLEGS